MSNRAIEIRCNGARVYFHAASFARGFLRLEPDTISEQCGGCGENIAASAALQDGLVVCTECGADYIAREVEMQS